MFGTIVSIVASGFVVGGLARWAIPGPDPMPFWLTVLFGLGGSAIGGGLAAGFLGTNRNVTEADYFSLVMASVLATMVLLIVYRRFYQKRPLTGPEAKRQPTKGIGLRPGTPAGPISATQKQELLRRIDELHDSGVLTDDEYVAKRREILSRWPT